MPAPGPDPLLEAEYLAGLRAAIMRHHYYPTRARRRHEEGRVRVAFLLRQDGRIEGLRVVASSGSRALDRAALRCVRAVGRYRPIPEVLDREQWPLEINIDFRLGDG
ncbi:MAG TPA: energy transducer TonB [Chromatiales bacterium]|nr:energy transducer TonB [Chromatiales bacterium]